MIEKTGVGAFGEKKKTARKETDSPCKACRNHNGGCHASCEPYKAWLEDKQARSREIREAKTDAAIYRDYERKKRKIEKEI